MKWDHGRTVRQVRVLGWACARWGGHKWHGWGRWAHASWPCKTLVLSRCQGFFEGRNEGTCSWHAGRWSWAGDGYTPDVGWRRWKWSAEKGVSALRGRITRVASRGIWWEPGGQIRGSVLLRPGEPISRSWHFPWIWLRGHHGSQCVEFRRKGHLWDRLDQAKGLTSFWKRPQECSL